MTVRRVRRTGRRSTPGVADGVSEQARSMVMSAREEAKRCENAQFGEMYATALERKVYYNDSVLFDFMKHLTHAPVSIEEFIEGEEYVGATDLKIWPEVRHAVITANRDWWKGMPAATHEILLCGATSTGKTEISKLTTLYHLYLLSCIDNPQAYYGLPKATSIVFAIMAAKPHVTKKVIYDPLRHMVENIPYFQKHLRPSKLVESEMIFEEKNIRVTPGGVDADSILGEAIVGGIIDEINFMNVVLRSKKAEVTTGRAGVYDQAQTIHSAMTRRVKGRFTKPGPKIGIVCTSSSTRYKGDFTDKRKKQVEDHSESGVYIYDKAQYEVKPQSNYCGDTFRLLVGNDILNDVRILATGDTPPEGARVLDIPVEYESEFRRDPHSALRDICGISTSSVSPFFQRRFKIYEAIAEGEEEGLSSFLVKDNVILGIDGMPVVKFGHYCTNPSRARFVHVDLSKTGDRCIAEGQPILLSDGRYLPIEKVSVGDTVVTHKGTHSAVTQCFSNGEKEVVEVHTYGWPYPLKATDTHKVWAVRRADVSYANGRLLKPSDRLSGPARDRNAYAPSFVEIGTLQPGDFLVTPRKQWQPATSLCGVPLAYGTGYIAGLFAAEGSFYMHHTTEYVQFSIHEDETQIRRNLDSYLQKYFGVSTRVCRDRKSKGITLRTQKNEKLVEFLLAAVGEYSHAKHLDCAHIGNPEFHAGVAHGYVDGDGYVKYNQNGEAVSFRVKTVSKQMAFSFYWLLVSGGFAPCMRAEPPYIDKEGTAHREYYTVFLSGIESMRGFAEWCGRTVEVPGSMSMALDDYLLTPITDIRGVGVCRVYDLEVEGEHSYVVGNTAVHNCGIAMLRHDGMATVSRTNGVVEKLPVASVELACSIEPDANNEIDFAEVRTWVKQLRDVYGYPIKAVTYDGIFSIESIQQWRKAGMRTGNLSVDRTSAPYKNLRDAYNDNRIRMFNQDILIAELFDLEFDDDKDKVDHSVHGSKDIADAVCGAYYSLLTKRSSWVVEQTADHELGGGRAEYNERFEGDRR